MCYTLFYFRMLPLSKFPTPPLIELLRFAGTLPIDKLPYSDKLSLFRLEYQDVFSAKLDRETDLPKPWGPAVN